MPAAPAHHAFTCGSKKEAATFALNTKKPFVIIQAGSLFYVYDCPKKLDADESAFRGHVHIREIVLKERLRRPFVDIDGDVDLDDLVRDLLDTFGGTSVLKFRTTKGVHLIAEDAPLINIREHAAGLLALKSIHPAVDSAVLHSLRFPGTRKPKGQCKEWPAGRKASELLCQPFNAPAADEEGPTADYLFDGLEEPIPDGFASAASTALSGKSTSFALREGLVGPGQMLDRAETSYCKICDCEHERENAFALRISLGEGLAYCFRKKSDPIKFSFGEKELPRGAGLFNKMSAEPYVAAPLHAGGPGCQAPEGDYLDASPCGIGKSRAAWASIAEGESVLCVSYRRAFTAKTASDYGLTQVPEKGILEFNRHTGLRAVVQLESLPRVKVEDGGLDVLLVDEWHGLMRQGFGNLASAKSRQATDMLETLILSAKRVIVLDAYAHDEDKEMFEKLTGRTFEFIKNCYKPHAGKTITVHKNNETNFKHLNLWIARRKPGEKIAVFAHKKSAGKYCVDSIATHLQAAGLRVKYYHSGTCQKQRAKDFADVSAAYKDVDAVVYNATVEAGVSIEIPEFKRLFCFSARFGSVEVIAQALHRFRCVEAIDYSGENGSRLSFAPQTAAAVQAAYQRSIRGRQLLPPEVNQVNAPGNNALAIDSFAGKAWIQTVLEEFRSSVHFDDRLLTMLADSGYEIKAGEGVEQFEPIKLDQTLVDESLLKSPAEKIADAMILYGEEVNQLKEDRAPKTEGTMLAIDRALLCEWLSVAPHNLTPEIVDKFKDRKDEFYAYKNLICGAINSKHRTSAHASSDEIVRRTSDLTEALGFGRLDKISTADLNRVAATALEESIKKGEKVIRDIHKNWGYLFEGLKRAPRRPALKDLTPRSVVAMTRTLLDGIYGLQLTNTNQSHPKRGSYELVPEAWPAEWLKDVPQSISAHRTSFHKAYKVQSEATAADFEDLLYELLA